MSFTSCSRSSKRLAAYRLPVLDFLAPSLAQSTRLIRYAPLPRRASSAASSRDSDNGAAPEAPRTPEDGLEAAAKPGPLHKPLTKAQRDFLTSAVSTTNATRLNTENGALTVINSKLRVNQAGELAATLIYASQTPPIVASHPHLRPLMKHMHDQEAGHFKTFNTLLAKHRIRPTAMYPIWSVMASAVGWGTAILGREAAMACTEAVETEIGDHYNGQVRILLDMVRQMEANGEEVGVELEELVSTIRSIRDEELEHLDHAVENDAKEAVPHALLTNVIRAGCRGAIWVSERV
jgi:ubiquinone biosynthesis monooxygenase Coq7